MATIESQISSIYQNTAIEPGYPLMTIKEMARRTGITPQTIVNAIISERVQIQDGAGPLSVKFFDTEPRPNPKKASRIRATIIGETQRYQRRPQFPTERKSRRTIKQKIERKTRQLARDNQRVTLALSTIPSNFTDRKSELKKIARWLLYGSQTQDKGSERTLIEKTTLTDSQLSALQQEKDLKIWRQKIGILGRSFEPKRYLEAISVESSTRGELAQQISQAIMKAIPQETIDIIDTVIGIPVVGFKNQSRVIEQTLDSLKPQNNLDRTLTILLVNRPTGEIPDATFERLMIEVKRGQFFAPICVVPGEIVRPIKIGDIRSAIFDGFILSRIKSQNTDTLANCSFIVMDDDFVRISPNWINAAKTALADEPLADLVTGLTTFETINSQAVSQKAFVMSESLRQKIAIEFLSELDRKARAGQELTRNDRNMVCQILFSKNPIQGTFLSGFAVRARAYLQTGGFAPMDEITRFIRQIALLGLEKNRTNIIYSPDMEIAADARRAIASYAKDCLPVVRQWQGSFPFQSDTQDPVRNGNVPVVNFPRDTEKLRYRMLEDTLDFFEIKNETRRRELISEFLVP